MANLLLVISSATLIQRFNQELVRFQKKKKKSRISAVLIKTKIRN